MWWWARAHVPFARERVESATACQRSRCASPNPLAPCPSTTHHDGADAPAKEREACGGRLVTHLPEEVPVAPALLPPYAVDGQQRHRQHQYPHHDAGDGSAR